MTYGYTLANWIGLAGLTLAMTGCPAGDDGDTGAETGPQPTTGVGTDGTTTDEASTSSPVTTMTEETTTGSVDSTGSVTCDPPCEAGEECIGGTCFDMAEGTTGEPPAECGLAVQLTFPNPACGPCAADNCCAELQGCFGDETTMMETECLQLNNCIVMNCATAMTLPDLMMCIDEDCAESSASLNTWLGYQSCLGMNCMAACS